MIITSPAANTGVCRWANERFHTEQCRCALKWLMLEGTTGYTQEWRTDEHVPPRYTIELWHRGKTKVADITRLCQDLDWSMTPQRALSR